MAFGYRYTLERQGNGWWLVRFPGIPEALTEGAGHSGPDRAVLPSLVTAKLAVYGDDAGPRLVQGQARERTRHVRELGAPTARPASQLTNVGHR